MMMMMMTTTAAGEGEPAGSSTLNPQHWVRNHGDALYRYAMVHMRGNSEAAEDRVQEAFVAALQSKNTFRGASSERTWLIGILRHKIQDAFRKQGRDAAHLGWMIGLGATTDKSGGATAADDQKTPALRSTSTGTDPSSAPGSTSERQGRETGESSEPASTVAAMFDRKGHWNPAPAAWQIESDPGRWMEREEFRKVLEQCLSKLPVRLHDVFILREALETSTSDVCEMLGLSATNLSTMLYRARMSLRRCLEFNWFTGAGKVR